MPDVLPTQDEFNAAFGITTTTPPPATPPDPPAGDGTPPAGGTPPAPELDPPAATPPATDPPPAPAASEPGAGTQPPTTPPSPAASDVVAKQAQAFAQMRVQNKTYEKTLTDIAGVLGITDTKDPNALLQALQEKVLAVNAQKQNIPVELLKTVQTLQAENEAARTAQMQQQAYLGFQQVKDTFKLTDDQLSEFAVNLSADGLNPFATPVDLVSEYRVRNWDRLMSEAKAAGIREEQERAAKAASQGATPPSQKQGQTGGDPGKINTVKDLNDFFNSK